VKSQYGAAKKQKDTFAQSSLAGKKHCIPFILHANLRLPNFEKQGCVGDGVGVARRQRFLFFRLSRTHAVLSVT